MTEFAMSSMKSVIEYIFVIVFALLVRFCVGLWSYSGANAPPMFGDFEAQRHWMEITYHLPIQQWYHEGPHNNLNYWGLDYPPLTAYMSYFCGYIGHQINPSWVALDSSHGIESPSVKLFMRFTAVVSDLLIFFPAAFLYSFYFSSSTSSRLKFFLLLLLQPALILIDHGHFQYNAVSLGLAFLGMTAIMSGQDHLGSFCYVCSICYKQMSLYYALPFFFLPSGYPCSPVRLGLAYCKNCSGCGYYFWCMLGSIFDVATGFFASLATYFSFKKRPFRRQGCKCMGEH